MSILVYRQKQTSIIIIEGYEKVTKHGSSIYLCNDKRISTTSSMCFSSASNSLCLVIQQKVVGFTSSDCCQAIGHQMTQSYFHGYHQCLAYGYYLYLGFLVRCQVLLLGIVPEAQDSNQELTCLSQNDGSCASDQGPQQTKQIWTAVDHGKRKNYWHMAHDLTE
jgi:hypothetical protein